MLKRKSFLFIILSAFLLWGCGEENSPLSSFMDDLEKELSALSSSSVDSILSSDSEIESSNDESPESSSSEPESSNDESPESSSSEPESSNDEPPESSSSESESSNDEFPESSSSEPESSSEQAPTYTPMSFVCPTKTKNMSLSSMTIDASVDVSGYLQNDSAVYIAKISVSGKSSGLINLPSMAYTEINNTLDGYKNKNGLEILAPLSEYMTYSPENNAQDTLFFNNAVIKKESVQNKSVTVKVIQEIDENYLGQDAMDYMTLQESRCSTLDFNTAAIKKMVCKEYGTILMIIASDKYNSWCK